MKKNRIMLMFLGLVSVLALGVFLYQSAVQEDTKKSVSIIFIPKTVDSSNEFWSTLIAGAKTAAKEHSAVIEIMAPDSEEDIDGQNRLILEAIEKKPDAIAISASSYERTKPYAKMVKENGIKLMFIDSEVDESIAEAVVATDNYRAGYQLGEYMKQFAGDDSHIAFVGHVAGVSTAIERERGMRDGLGAYEKNVEQVLFCNSVLQNAYDLTIQLLKEHPEINMIAGMNEYSAVGMASAIKEKQLQDKITVFGIDNSVVQINLLEADVYKAIIVQNSFNMGYLGIEKLIACVNGEKIDYYTDSGSTLITKEDMYTEENQKLLFPFIGSQATEEIKLNKEE